MPFQPMDLSAFANMLLQQQRQNQPPDIMEEFKKGYQLSQMPGQMARKREEEELANSLQKMKVDQYPEDEKIARALKEAQVGKLQKEGQSPFGGKSLQGFAGQAYDIQQLEDQLGPDHPTVKLAKSLANAEIGNKESRTKRNNALTDTTDIRLLSPDAKREREGWGRALGLTPEQLNEKARKGQSIADIAQEQGKDISQLEPIYALSPIEVRQDRQRQGFKKEIDVLSDKIVGPLSETARQLMGYPLDMLYKQFNGKLSDDEFSQILAAGAIVPELNALRYKNLGGTVGITALHDMEEKLKSKFKTLGFTISPEVSKGMNKYIKEWINESTDAYSNYLKESSRVQPKGTSYKTGDQVTADAEESKKPPTKRYKWDDKLGKSVEVTKP